jgi:hypothetical protein
MHILPYSELIKYAVFCRFGILLYLDVLQQNTCEYTRIHLHDTRIALTIGPEDEYYTIHP